MATLTRARNALTIALLAASAAPVEATDYPEGIIVDSGSAILLDPGDTILVSGPTPKQAVLVEGRASFDAEGIAIRNETAGDTSRRAYGIAAVGGAEVALKDSSVTMTGDIATGLQVQGNSHASLDNVDLTLDGARAIGVAAWHGASLELDDTRVVTRADDAAALVLVGGSATLSGSELRSERGYAILTRFVGARNDVTVSLRNSLVRGRIETGDRRLTLHAVESRLVSDIVRGGEGRLDVTLDRTFWRGRAQDISSLTIREGDWQVAGDVDSRVRHLALGHAGRVRLDDESTVFRTLRLGALDAAEGNEGIRLRTRLDAGGSISAQGTDRLLVEGDVEGSTPLDIVHRGGAGASTEIGARGGRAEEGISIVQVGGRAEASSFRLRDGHIAVGPFRYGLYAYAPDESSAAQRLLEGEGDHWDFRLQTVHVDEEGATSPREWTRDATESRADDARDALAPQVPSYLVLPHALFGYGRDLVDAVHTQGIPADDERPRMRASVFGGDATYRSPLAFADYGIDYTRSGKGLIVSGDLLAGWIGDARGRAGLAASVGSSILTPRVVDGAGIARTRSRGLMSSYTLDAESGWRIDATYGFTHHRIDVSTPYRGEVLGRLRANANDASLAASFRWEVSDRFALSPSVSAVWQKLRFSRGVDRDGIVFDGGSPERTTLRGGAHMAWSFEPRSGGNGAWSPYLDARYVITRGSGQHVDLSGVSLTTGRAGRGVELAAGAAFQLRHDVTLRLATTTRHRLGRGGESGWQANAGIAWQF